jgi:hypothetical protein
MLHAPADKLDEAPGRKRGKPGSAVLKNYDNLQVKFL